MKVCTTTLVIIFFLSVINLNAQISGCTDPLAVNYNPSAFSNDGSCTYTESAVLPLSSLGLADTLSETSGLIIWADQIWTINDNEDSNIYALDTATGNLLQTIVLNETQNNDWEEISQDDNYIYIGDFGNNVNGNRTDLKILRVDKNSILANSTVTDTINFTYSNQNSLAPVGNNNTDFDCEAFIVSTDSIYLFTKQWVSNKTSVYSLSKNPGTYTAQLKDTLDVGGLITGAVYNESERLIALCGYSNILQPFVFLLYDFTGTDYFDGNKRKIDISLPFYQVEGIATNNCLNYYISNEYFTQPPFITTPQKLHILDLSSFLVNYLKNSTYISNPKSQYTLRFFPVPADDYITFETNDDLLPVTYYLSNQMGQIIFKGELTNEKSVISVSDLSSGVYMFSVGDEIRQSYKVVKK